MPAHQESSPVGRRSLRQLVPPYVPGEGASTGDDLFLADHLFNTSGNILEDNEQLRLLDALRPVYERQPAHVLAMKRWTEWKCGVLERTGQSQQVLKLRKQLAADYPHDSNLQQQYAQALANAGDYPAAYAWLDRVLVPAAKWLPQEEESLIATHCDLLQQQGRYDDLVEYLAGWVKRNPPGQNIYARYLSALVSSDHAKQADDLIRQWIRDAEQAVEASKLPSPSGRGDVDARLRAAVSQALGQGYNLNTNRIDPQWLKPLADAAICFARHPSAAGVADQIMGHWIFQQSDECGRVRKAAERIVLDEMGTLPVDQWQRFLGWTSPNGPADSETWKKIATGLRARWDAEPDWQVKNQFGGMLAGVLQAHLARSRGSTSSARSSKARRKTIAQGMPGSFSMPCSGSHGNRPTRTRSSGCSRNSLPPISRRRNSWRCKSPRSAR